MFKQVLGRCERFVRRAAEGDNFRCLFQVPLYVPGLPLYNLTDCTLFMKAQLEDAGFVVTCFLPNLLLISWDLADLEGRQQAGAGEHASLPAPGNRRALKAPASGGAPIKSVRFLTDGSESVPGGGAGSRKFSINLG